MVLAVPLVQWETKYLRFLYLSMSNISSLDQKGLVISWTSEGIVKPLLPLNLISLEN